MGPDTLLVGLSLLSFFCLVLVWVVQPSGVPATRDLPRVAADPA